MFRALGSPPWVLKGSLEPFALQHEDLLADPPSGGQLVPGRSPLHHGDGQDHKTLIKQISNGAYRQPPKPSGE